MLIFAKGLLIDARRVNYVNYYWGDYMQNIKKATRNIEFGLLMNGLIWVFKTFFVLAILFNTSSYFDTCYKASEHAIPMRHEQAKLIEEFKI